MINKGGWLLRMVGRIEPTFKEVSYYSNCRQWEDLSPWLPKVAHMDSAIGIYYYYYYMMILLF